MRNIVRRLAWPAARDDRGAIGVLIAILIGGGVLLGMGALAIDTGQLYQNRAELQGGADAGALAVARNCAQGTCTLSNAVSTAARYATANASKLTGGAAGVDLVCGSGSLGTCPASNGTLADCPAAPALGTNGGYVDVHTSTRLPNGSTLLPPVFATTLIGNSSYHGTNVRACAQAEWGPPATANTIAFTISACEWDTATNNGANFAPPPPYPPYPAASFDQAITLHTGVTSGTCAANPADADAPGAFGWTQDVTGTCNVVINNNTYITNTGASAGNTCKTALQAAWTNKTLVFVPVYSSVTGTGSNTVYTLKGFAAFVITGFRVPGLTEPDWLNPGLLCSPPKVCIDGFFTQGLLPSDGSLGGTNLGADIIKLTG
jgi:Flp pilus assembly protein TadG